MVFPWKKQKGHRSLFDLFSTTLTHIFGIVCVSGAWYTTVPPLPLSLVSPTRTLYTPPSYPRVYRMPRRPRSGLDDTGRKKEIQFFSEQGELFLFLDFWVLFFFFLSFPWFLFAFVSRNENLLRERNSRRSGYITHHAQTWKTGAKRRNSEPKQINIWCTVGRFCHCWPNKNYEREEGRREKRFSVGTLICDEWRGISSKGCAWRCHDAPGDQFTHGRCRMP